MTVNDFLYLEPYLILDMLKDSRERKEEAHLLNFIAMKNAIGTMFSKEYKYFDAFKEKEEEYPKEYSQDEYNSLLDDLNGF